MLPSVVPFPGPVAFFQLRIEVVAESFPTRQVGIHVPVAHEEVGRRAGPIHAGRVQDDIGFALRARLRREQEQNADHEQSRLHAAPPFTNSGWLVIDQSLFL